MKKFKLSLIISFLLHTLLLFSYSKNDQIKKITQREPIKMKVKSLKQKKSSIQKNFSKNYRAKGLKLSDFSINPKHLNIDDAKISTNSNIGIAKANQIFSKIEQNLTYPEELVEIEAQGHFQVTFYLDKNAQYEEKRTKISVGSRFLRAYIAKVLRKSLKNIDQKDLKLQKLTKFNAVFKFNLTTSATELGQSQLLKDRYFFYRQRYGVSTGRDRVMNGVTKTLTGITNILSLLEYLPDSDATKLRKKRVLETYIKDPFY
ncbi:hypothetical protein ABMA70_14880 [Halobacteriovorax sp. XZX-3]|uniref:hypothetical protein n=1 Tax=unclassified Halobacteriovorax TaxID=2639665 RepID=UPI003720D328